MTVAGPKLPPLVAGRRRWLLARLIGNGIGQTLLALGWARLVHRGFEQMIHHAHAATLRFEIVLAVGLSVLFAATTSLRWLQRVDAERLAQDYAHQLRTGLFAALAVVSPRVLRRRSHGDLMLPFLTDISTINQWVTTGLSRIVVAGITSVGIVGVLATLDVHIAVSVAVVLALGWLGLSRAALGLQATSREARRKRAFWAADLAERVAAAEVVQVFGQVAREVGRIEGRSRSLVRAMIARAGYIGLAMALADGAAAGTMACVLIVGSHDVISGTAHPATIVSALALIGLLTPALRSLGRVQQYLHSARVAATHLGKAFALSAHALPERGAVAAGAPGSPAVAVELRGVRLTGVLEEVNAAAAPGEFIVLRGQNGSGKSTLLSMLAGLVVPDGGSILLNGAAVQGARVPAGGGLTAMVSQQLPLFRGTIRENVTYRRPDAVDAEVARAVHLSGLGAILEDLPGGEAFEIEENGTNLSLGMRARVALARALLGEPGLLLLDEVDANLDPAALLVLQYLIEQRHATVIMVTHRPEWLARADAVWTVHEGRISEERAQQLCRVTA